MLRHQSGAISLFWVAICAAVFAAVAMAALFSMRYERNLFAEGLGKVSKTVGGAGLVQKAQEVAGGRAPAGGGVLRKCIIGGKTVISDIDCKTNNSSSKVIEIHDTAGIEAPKVPVPAPAPAEAATTQAIEKATR
ncbi:hypothetical protein AAKU55_004007 [Oxalobacteraceae bacterium GrIS 1.11]